LNWIITRTVSVKDFKIFFYSKLYYHNHVNFIFSYCTKLLSLVCSVPLNFPSLEYISYYITLHTNKPELIQQKFAALSFNRFYPQVDHSYALSLQKSKLYIIQKRMHHLENLFLTHVYRGSKFSPSVLETVGLQLPARYKTDFSMFNVCSSSENCPDRCASAANVFSRDIGLFDLCLLTYFTNFTLRYELLEYSFAKY
jgi:hypothetical protein